MEEVKRTQEDLIVNKEAREKFIERYDVLEKVKRLLLLPGTELATVKQVAEFYSTYRTESEKENGLTDILITEESIQKIYQRNKDEFSNDGVILMKSKDFLNWTKCPSQRGSTTMLFKNGELLTIPNIGVKVFTKRAILRIGMLLRDSEVAKEVRTQLLNIEEKASAEIKTQDINEEQTLLLNVGLAYANGDINAMLKATTEYNAFQNRHIQKLENDKRALSESILEWEDRKKLNAGIRRLAVVTGNNFATIWNELYRNLQYKYSICLKQRGTSPYIQYVKESEWQNVIKTFCAMCDAYNQSPTDMFQQTILKTNITN